MNSKGGSFDINAYPLLHAYLHNQMDMYQAIYQIGEDIIQDRLATTLMVM